MYRVSVLVSGDYIDGEHYSKSVPTAFDAWLLASELNSGKRVPKSIRVTSYHVTVGVWRNGVRVI